MIYDIHQLSFGYRAEPVVRDVSLQVESGEFIAVVGPNGAGKSTLLKLMAGLLDDFSGSIAFMDRPIGEFAATELACRVAVVPQETHVAFPFTVEEMVLMGRLPYRRGFVFDTEEDVEYAAEAMRRTDTAYLARRLFSELSGGERQRVVLAGALAQMPDMLLLDEPTVYLDMKHQVQFYEILEQLNLHGITVLAVTHDINLAARYARRMIAVREGSIVRDGTPDEVLTPDNLHEIFEVRAVVVDRPEGGKYVIPS